MNRRVKLALAFASALAVGHVGVVLATPYALMQIAMKRLSHDGQEINRFHFGPRTTQDSRAVVRPSPDLAYSSCVYDLRGGPLLVTAGPSPNAGYVSLSVFDARSDNIGVYDSLHSPGGLQFVLALDGQAVPNDLPVLRSPSRKGIILDRRLAPSAEAFAAADKARQADACAPLKGYSGPNAPSPG